MGKKPRKDISQYNGGGDFTRALRKNIPPIDQFFDIKENSNSLLNNTKELLSIYSPVIGPVAKTLTSIPCAAAKMYTNAICNPLNMFSSSLGQVGGAKYKNHYYNYIYDPISKEYYNILSKKGEATLMGYIGKVSLYSLK